MYKAGTNLKEILADFTPRKEKNKNNIFLIIGSAGDGFGLKDFQTRLPTKEMDLELNYGATFVKKHQTIINRLNTQNDSGLVLLNGQPGTGKTTYIKYLTTLLDKKIIFVPPSMAEGITAPTFLPFLMEHKNSILVIEDAEKVVGSRESSDTNNGVSNILNMTDGILGDCLNIQIIATLNTPREKVDAALLRKGRLIAEYEFTELPLENVEKLFKHLDIKDKPEGPMTLTDIYNYERVKEDRQNEKPIKRMGFCVEAENK
jgi:ATP-dependent 26S proteasome regulatory subunit